MSNKYCRVIDGVPVRYWPSDLKKEYPNVSFPVDMSDELLAEYNIFPLVDQNAPEITCTWTQMVTNGDIELIDGVYTQTCIMIENIEWPSNVDTWRREELANTDWVVTKALEAGEPVPQEWVDYRQALRDLAEFGFDDIDAFEMPVRPST